MGQGDERVAPARIGRYDVRRELGSGGAGVVYAAYDPELDREVAVKLMHDHRLRSNPAFASERLRREAQITAKLAHPNVVTIFEVGEHDGAVYIAMELVDGPSLQAWIEQVARPWREVLSMYFQAGLGLAAAHQGGLVHRDFKPANVLVGDRRARVVDFGLAHVGAVPASAGVQETTALLDTLDGFSDDRSLGRSHDLRVTGPSVVTVTDSFVGTPAYMAPELFSGGGADARTDQFAFCVSLYEAMYGQRPFRGATTRELAEEVLAGNVLPAPHRTRIPRWVHSIIERGLRVDPADRHPSIQSMLAAIAFTAKIMWD